MCRHFKHKPQGTERILDDPRACANIRKMARMYIMGRYTYAQLGEKFGIARTTVGKYFYQYLPYISPTLSKLVTVKAAHNAEVGRRKGLKKLLALAKARAKKDKQ